MILPIRLLNLLCTEILTERDDSIALGVSFNDICYMVQLMLFSLNPLFLGQSCLVVIFYSFDLIIVERPFLFGCFSFFMQGSTREALSKNRVFRSG